MWLFATFGAGSGRHEHAFAYPIEPGSPVHLLLNGFEAIDVRFRCRVSPRPGEARQNRVAVPVKFAGVGCYQGNGDTGLVHVGARYYDPQVGRFASRDSMLDQIPYAYCAGEPNDWLDPTGCSKSWLSGLAKIGAGVVALSPAIEIGYMVYEAIDGLHKGYEARRCFHKMRRSPLPTAISLRPGDGGRRVDPGWRGRRTPFPVSHGDDDAWVWR